jgi:hypothetical protein
MSGQEVSRSALLTLYRNILRACETYPSSSRQRLYQAIREEFRENKTLDDSDDNTTSNKRQRTKQIALAYQGLSQLRQYSEQSLSGGNQSSSSWSVTLEQNPMPPPPKYEKKKNRRLEPNPNFEKHDRSLNE